jgi:hypothetical protein
MLWSRRAAAVMRATFAFFVLAKFDNSPHSSIGFPA